MNQKALALQRILDKTVDGKKIFGTSFAVKKEGQTWIGASGNIATDQPYFIASTTKLFVTALILRFTSDGKLRLDDRISKYLSADIVHGLHVYKGKDYSDELTVTHLLAHTSGLADYFQNKDANGKSLQQYIVSGIDQSWTFGECIERTKSMKPLFVPGTKGKAHYSDTNFQLLGKLIETITGKSFDENCVDYIITPLALSKTYLYKDASDNIPKTLYYKSNELYIPQAMTSFGPDGGMVSTAADMLVFIEAFFTGKLFPLSYINDLQKWNGIFFPMQSGVGIHAFKLPWIFDPTRSIPDLIGHSGLSGALAFYSPKDNIYIAGTVNQVAHPDASFRTMIKLAQTLLKK
jgi:D-alanyl-D-alanine carboxypeptidase